MIKKIVYFFIAIVLSGCLTKATIKESTPTLGFTPPPEIIFTVIDNREYVVNGDKEDNFEGFNRALYGIPTSFVNLRDNKTISYANRIKQLFVLSFENAGSSAATIESPKGSTIMQGIKNIKPKISNKGMIIHVNDSKIDAGGMQWQYFYDYEFVVINKSGDILFRKRFKGRDVDFQRAIFKQGQSQGKNYNYGSILSIHYKNKLSKFINDKELSHAIITDGKLATFSKESRREKSSDIESRLLKLQTLKTKGIITEADFQLKKKEILNRFTLAK